MTSFRKDEAEGGGSVLGLLERTAAEQPGAVALRFKEAGAWRTTTYRALLRQSRRVAAGLRRQGVRPKDRVALFLDNLPAWPEIYFGILAAGATAVPLDPKLQEQEAAHMLRHSGSRLLFASPKNADLAGDLQGQLPDLKTVVVLGLEGADRSGRLGYEEFLAGEDDIDPSAAPNPEDLASIIYTSGTTGRSKGVMLTHRNFCANVDSIQRAIDIHPSDVFLLVLPLYHAFAFVANLLLPVALGAEVCFVENIKTVAENARETSPTVLLGVPLLIEKMHRRLLDGLRANPLAWLMYRLGLRAVLRRRILARLGGRLRMFVVGGAPCPLDVLRGFQRMGLPLIEGYGMTEAAPVLTLNLPGRVQIGTVGEALPDIEIRIDEPDEEGSGEILARGPNIMPGYFRDPEATAQVLQDDGWLRTGDLGRLDRDGRLTITGRKKSLIVNREGKNIHPEEVESHLGASPYLLEVLALGYRPTGETGERVGVIVVPNQDALDALEKERGRPLSDAELTDLMKREVKRTAAGLADYKRPRRIQIRSEAFEKTPIGKIKRHLYAMAPGEL